MYQYFNMNIISPSSGMFHSHQKMHATGLRAESSTIKLFVQQHCWAGTKSKPLVFRCFATHQAESSGSMAAASYIQTAKKKKKTYEATT